MSEFPRPLNVAELSGGAKQAEVSATPAELQTLAERFAVEAIGAMAARLRLRLKNGRLYVSGELEADIQQICVVSLEPFWHRITAQIEEEYLLTDSPDSVEVDVDETSPEPLTGDSLDLGEMVAQNLALLIDPHPRADGADLGDLEYDLNAQAQADASADHPFSKLKNLVAKG